MIEIDLQLIIGFDFRSVSSRLFRFLPPSDHTNGYLLHLLNSEGICMVTHSLP